jgi:hypothetical protein
MGDSQDNARRPVVAAPIPEAARGSSLSAPASSTSRTEEPQQLIGRADQVVIVAPRATVMRCKVS